MSLAHIDRLIVDGKIKQARQALLAMDTSEVQKVDHATKLAALFRRVDWSSKGIKTLAPFVLGRGRRQPIHSDHAKVEYAHCLKNLGLLNESRKILSTGLDQHSVALNVLALSYVSDYELEKAEALLLKIYRNHAPHFTHYQRQVIGVNLCIAWLRDVESQDRRRQFHSILNELMQECENHSYTLLLRHLRVFELQFQVLASELERNLEQFTPSQDLPEFWWYTAQFYIELARFMQKTISTQEINARLESLRSECLRFHLPEVAREIDFHRARVMGDSSAMQKVLDQTLYSAFRKKILACEQTTVIEQNFRVLGANHDHSSTFQFDLILLKDEPLLARMMQLFAQEGYLALSSHFLWDRLMPNRQYREPSSKACVHQLIARLKKFLKKIESRFKSFLIKVAIDFKPMRLVGFKFHGQKIGSNRKRSCRV